MKELLKQYAMYHHWANQKLFEVILSLPEEKQQEVVTSSFPSVHKTLLHMWDAESAWWQRLKLNERITVPSENFQGSTADIIQGLLHQDKLWEEWISQASDRMLEHVFQYKSFKNEQFKQPIFQMVLHVLNHGTYHRGQLVTMLRQLGITKIPQTDFVVWTRLRK